MAKRVSAIALAALSVLGATACIYADWDLPPADGGGVPDGGGSDAAPDAGFSCKGTFLCDDFEKGAFNAQWSSFFAGDGGALGFDAAPDMPRGSTVLIASREGKP